VPGIAGSVFGDKFNGSLADLQSLAGMGMIQDDQVSINTSPAREPWGRKACKEYKG